MIVRRFATVALAAMMMIAAFARPAFAETALAAGDVLDVQVYGEQTLTQQVTIAPDGSITYPLVGRIALAGKTTTQAGDAIAGALSRYIRHPMVVVTLHTVALYNVLVLGNVKTPGRYTLQPGSKLTDAIAAAGGLGPVNGALPDARVSINDRVSSVSLDALLRRGDLGANVALANNAAVYVPAPLTIRVRVMGAVDKPGDVEVNEGDHLMVAIAKAGNSTNAHADLNRITLSRKAPDGSVSRTQVNLYDALRKGNAQADPTLAADDVIFVPEGKGNSGDAGFGVLGVLRRLFFPF
jgi:polysaccharide biosynthesis/export protein